MPTMRAVVVDPQAPRRLVLRQVEAPAPGPAEALVRMAATSLNRGEVRRAMTADDGWRPGWDVAGSVERAATDGTGPSEGTRVVGLVNSGAWAELVAVPTRNLATLPDNVTFEQAATLPIAALTALYAVDHGGNLLGRKVLITGASGGAGQFAVELAKNAGAFVVALIHQARHVDGPRKAGADEVLVGDDATEAGKFGPFDLIVDSVGGPVLGTALGLLASGGTCVCFGTSAGGNVTFAANRFYAAGATTFRGLIIFYEVARDGASKGLSRLVSLISDDRLHPTVEVEESWEEIGSVAQRLIDRGYSGKAVIRIGD